MLLFSLFHFTLTITLQIKNPFYILSVGEKTELQLGKKQKPSQTEPNNFTKVTQFKW